MKMPNRDLLVLVKDEFRNQESMEVEVEQLNRLLMGFETIENFCTAHEVYDLNRFRLINAAHHIQRICREKEIKPFLFIGNKN